MDKGRHAGRESGLTLIEMLITLVVLTVVMVGLYGLLDSSNKLAKQETNVAEAQQSVRIGVSEVTRVVRQGRVGGLFIANAILPIENNSAGGVSYTDVSGIPHFVRKGTDVIGVRGIISGDKYGLATGDVTCGGSCATTNAMTITIRSTSTSGIVNFASGSLPSMAAKTRPFYFVVADGSSELMTTGVGTYLVPVYYVGLVNTAGTWYTQTADTFTFVMDPQDSGALKLTAMAPTASALDKPYSAGVVDEIRFFVDEGPVDASASSVDTHPSLAEATFEPGSGNWEIQPLIEDVEDFQVAYGVDGINGSARDLGISPAAFDTSGSNSDEWVGNVANEVSTTLPQTNTDPKRVEAFIDSSVPTGPTAPAVASAALRSVMVGLVVKSADPDFKYSGPGARGFALLDSTAESFSAKTGRPYRRRLQRFAVSLRNYQ
ncbi:MAG TPA: PilW family protein [Thermoanaerobaculia bacterium]|nr:PilW family protein [Thermoanaerobaculia bacterium]